MKRFLLAIVALLLLAAGAAATLWFGFPEVVLERRNASAREAAGLVEHRLRVGAHEVAYDDRGGDGVPLVLLHGFSADKQAWLRMAQHVPVRQRVITIDLPGWGESDFLEEENYSYEQQAERVGAILSALSVPRAHLVGNSMGGAIASLFAADHPERVASLTLIDSFGVDTGVATEFSRALQRGEMPFLIENEEDLDELVALVFAKPPQLPGPIKRAAVERARSRQPVRKRIAADLQPAGWVMDHWARIRVPTLVLWGRQDRFFHHSAAEVLERTIPGAKSVVLDDCGHVPMIEKPEQTAELCLTFIDSLKP